MRLCKALGKTRRQLLAEADSEEISEWLAYDRIEPLDDPYWRTGVLAATVANYSGHARRTLSAEDFMPRRIDPDQAEAQSVAEAKARMIAFAAAHNASAHRREAEVK